MGVVIPYSLVTTSKTWGLERVRAFFGLSCFLACFRHLAVDLEGWTGLLLYWAVPRTIV